MIIEISGVIPDLGDARQARAIRAAIEGAVSLYPVTDDATFAVRTHGCEGVNRTLETVKNISFSGLSDLKGSVIVISAYFALRHNSYSL